MESGESFGSYKLISRIGSGGMGEVWKAEDPRLHRIVAIKIINESVSKDAETNARFKREARTAAQLNHPNIATIYTIEEFDGRELIVMEYVDGEPLGYAMRTRRLTELDVALIGRSVAEALAEAHDKGIVHRDIKPDNIVLSGARVKVLDFGIAKRYAFEDAEEGNDSSRITAEFRTQNGVILGTVHYMSPEQAMGKKVDGRSDIFSLGVVLYEVATGRLPFAGETLTDTLTRIIRDDPPDLQAAAPNVSSALAGVIMRCLAKDREKRFANAGELAKALDAIAQSAQTARGRTAVTPPSPADSNKAPTLISAPRAAVPPTVVQQSRTATVVVPARGSSVPWGWILGTLVLVAGSVAVTAWYFARVVASRDARTPAPVAAQAAPVPAAATVVAVAPSASEPPAAATMTITELAGASAPPAVAPRAGTPPPPMPPPPKLQGGILTAERTPPPPRPPTPELAEANDAFLEGRRYVAAKQEMSAYDSFKRAVKLDPQHAPAWVALGFIELHEQKDSVAASDFSTALKFQERLMPDDVEIAEFGLAVATGDQDAVTRLCLSPRFDREFDVLRRFAKERGAQDCRVLRGFPSGGGRGSRTAPVKPKP